MSCLRSSRCDCRPCRSHCADNFTHLEVSREIEDEEASPVGHFEKNFRGQKGVHKMKTKIKTDQVGKRFKEREAVLSKIYLAS